MLYAAAKRPSPALFRTRHICSKRWQWEILMCIARTHLCMLVPWKLSSKLVCADCGHPLVAARETQRRKNGTVKHYTSYFCSRFATTGHSICSWHRIFEISLKNLVLSEIRAHGKAVAADEAAVLDKLKQHIQSASAAQQEDCRQEISRLRRRLEELEQITAKLYEDKVSGAISGDERLPPGSAGRSPFSMPSASEDNRQG